MTFHSNITTRSCFSCTATFAYLKSLCFTSKATFLFIAGTQASFVPLLLSWGRPAERVQTLLVFDIKPQCALCLVSFGCLPSALYTPQTHRVVSFWLCGAFLGSFWRLCVHTFFFAGRGQQTGAMHCGRSFRCRRFSEHLLHFYAGQRSV